MCHPSFIVLTFKEVLIFVLESQFQSSLIKELEELYPTSFIFKNETKQGFPDLTILHPDGWALLECKRSKDASHRPNQDWYIEHGKEMQFASFIYPENKKEVLDALQQTLRPGR